MEAYKLGEMEQKFTEIIWANVPMSSLVLTELCAKAFGWKHTTTYTMLRHLCERKIFENQSRIIALMTKQKFQNTPGEQFLNKTFGGFLPQFFAAFTQRNKLTQTEISELQRLIYEHKEG